MTASMFETAKRARWLADGAGITEGELVKNDDLAGSDIRWHAVIIMQGRLSSADTDQH